MFVIHRTPDYFNFLPIFCAICLVSFSQAKSIIQQHHSLETTSSLNLSPSTLSAVNFAKKTLSESELVRKIRSPCYKSSKCNCEDDANEFEIEIIGITSKKPKTTPKTPRTYRPPRVQNPLQIDDESIEWVESGVSPDWIRTSLEDFRSSIENESK